MSDKGAKRGKYGERFHRTIDDKYGWVCLVNASGETVAEIGWDMSKPTKKARRVQLFDRLVVVLSELDGIEFEAGAIREACQLLPKLAEAAEGLLPPDCLDENLFDLLRHTEKALSKIEVDE